MRRKINFALLFSGTILSTLLLFCASSQVSALISGRLLLHRSVGHEYYYRSFEGQHDFGGHKRFWRMFTWCACYDLVLKGFALAYMN